MSLAVHLADADYGWAYVIVGWTLTGAVLAAYFSRLVVRIRRAERTLPPEPAAAATTGRRRPSAAATCADRASPRTADAHALHRRRRRCARSRSSP